MWLAAEQLHNLSQACFHPVLLFILIALYFHNGGLFAVAENGRRQSWAAIEVITGSLMELGQRSLSDGVYAGITQRRMDDKNSLIFNVQMSELCNRSGEEPLDPMRSLHEKWRASITPPCDWALSHMDAHCSPSLNICVGGFFFSAQNRFLLQSSN